MNRASPLIGLTDRNPWGVAPGLDEVRRWALCPRHEADLFLTPEPRRGKRQRRGIICSLGQRPRDQSKVLPASAESAIQSPKAMGERAKGQAARARNSPANFRITSMPAGLQ
jgi:hypothetical protein